MQNVQCWEASRNVVGNHCLSRKTPPKHNVSTSMFDSGDGVLGVIGSIPPPPNTASWADAMPKSLILVSSDHNTFTQFSSESFRCPLANFRRACTCAFLSRGTLRALQDFSPSWRSAGFLKSCPGKANALQSLAPTLIKFTYLWFSNDPEDIDWHAQVCLIRVRAKLCRKVDLVGQIWGSLE